MKNYFVSLSQLADIVELVGRVVDLKIKEKNLRRRICRLEFNWKIKCKKQTPPQQKKK